MKLYEFKEVVWAFTWAALVVFFGIGFFIYSMAWMNHEYNQEEMNEIPRFERKLDTGLNSLSNRISEVENNQSRIMPSCLSGYATKVSR